MRSRTRATDPKRGERLGEIVGLTSGAAVGRIVAGPIGGLVGAALGEIVGGQVGQETAGVRTDRRCCAGAADDGRRQAVESPWERERRRSRHDSGRRRGWRRLWAGRPGGWPAARSGGGAADRVGEVRASTHRTGRCPAPRGRPEARRPPALAVWPTSTRMPASRSRRPRFNEIHLSSRECGPGSVCSS